jgi:hypothetical protein
MYRTSLSRLFSGSACLFTLLAGLATPAQAVEQTGATPLVKGNVIRLDINGCTEQLADALADIGLGSTTSAQGRADAVLEGNISNYVPKDERDESRGDVDVSYWAVVRDAAGLTVSANSGREGSSSVEEVCEDVAEEIVDRIENDMMP